MSGNIYQYIDPAQLSGVAGLMVAAEDQAVNTASLTPWFPSLPTNSIKWEHPTGTTRTYTAAAPFRAFDTPAALGSRPGRGWASGKLAPISIKFPLGELDQIKIREMAAQGAPFEDIVGGDILDDVGNGVRAIINRNQLAMSELLRTGKLVLAERGLSLEYDAERSADRATVLAGTAQWNTADNTDPTPGANERAALSVLKSYGLEWSDLYVICNQATWDTYISLQEIIDLYQSFRVVPRLNDSQAIQVRAEQRLPEVLVNDRSIVPYNASSASKVIPDGQWIYVPKTAVGRSQYAPTVAQTSGKVDLGQGAEGGIVSYVMDKEDPITLETLVEAYTIPTFHDPDATFALTVYT